MRNKIIKYLIATTSIVCVVWLALTLWVEQQGPARDWEYPGTSGKSVLLVFDPDPIYNLDEQICLAIARSLSDHDVQVIVATVKSAITFPERDFDLYVICANTYNWRPDLAISRYIESSTRVLHNKPVVAITLGGGSTESSQEHLEKLIRKTNARLLASHRLWLWRPNDERRLSDNNVEVALEHAASWGNEISRQLESK